MSRVSSLGLHTPAALPYCITEGLLPDPPPPSSYTWTTGLPHEELLVTGSTVIWSQGGVIRRVFRYDVEKEAVVQAVLTWFPSDDPLDAKRTSDATNDDEEEGSGYVSGGSESNKRKTDWGDEAKAKKRISTWSSTKTKSYAAQLGNFPKAKGAAAPIGGKVEQDADDVDAAASSGRARALVVFLETQAFAYFLSGNMHILHLPFKVRNAMAAPYGLIIERKLPDPPLSPSIPTNNIFSQRPVVNNKDSPRLFTLTDPLSEVGLVMNTANAPCIEDLVFISSSSELESVELEDSQNFRRKPSLSPDIMFAVTNNRELRMITVWQVRYIPQEPPVSKRGRRVSAASGTASRRRSSFGPGTGATTPVAGGGTGSIASSATVKAGRDSLDPGDAVSLGGLDEDFTTGGRRSSRRVSSLVARADLSGNHDVGQRFSDIASSLGASFGAPPAPNNSMVIDEQPVDELLNELNMGALGIGMDDLGAYDGEGLKQEMLMHKVEAFPCRPRSGVKGELGASGGPTRVFTLAAPSSSEAATTSDKASQERTLALFIVNKDEYNMIQLIFRIKLQPSGPGGFPRRASVKYGAAAMGYTPVLIDTQKREDVLDAIKLQDGGVEKVLILAGDGKLELYSPWGGNMDIVLPPTLSRWNPNVVGEDGSRRGSRKKGFARSLSTTPDSYQQLKYSEAGGRVTVIDGDGVGHRIGIKLAPRDSSIRTCLETLRVVMGATGGTAVGEGIWMSWMVVSKWLLITSDPEAGLSQDTKGTTSADEWKAFVTTLFLLAVPQIPEPKPQSRRKSAFLRSSSMVAQKEWEDIVCHEGEWGSSAEYARSTPWRWMIEEEDQKATKYAETHTRGRSSAGSNDGRLMNKFITDCLMDARLFAKSDFYVDVQNGFFKIAEFPDEVRRTGLAVALVALHLLREEWKLDITMEVQLRRMSPVLRQIAAWLGWSSWAEEYMLEDVEMGGWAYDQSRISAPDVPQAPFPPPDIYKWLMDCLKGGVPAPFMVLQDIGTPTNVTPSSTQQSSQSSQRPRNPFSPPPPPGPAPIQKPVFGNLTPKTRIVTALYSVLATAGSTDINVVEKMVELKITLSSIQWLPEGIGIPLREAIAKCQEQPPTTWGVAALDLVGRKDLRMLIEPVKGRSERGSKWQSAPTHEAMRDVHTICNTAFDTEVIGTYDHMAEHDRQSIARLLFKDDRRLFEAAKLLQSNKPTLAKCLPQPHWNEQETLDAYKDVAGHAALRTLAVPPGRGLFYFSARIPLLTERFPVTGFNLSCIVKPATTTVSADKSVYTEEKVCWAFFHAGVAAGVSISREAKEIDDSWIVFNKPTELTNRHAGFLLGLGLNGHLKNIAKWHAFNYLTPKHTMISIGLLLGLSASYLGTMDTTVTKLLSVHVTRLLPPGSAELNLSPLTQTAGIMGIGLLYASTQHRRMSEVMLSEIEYVEVQDTCVPMDNLRDEGYRLAAGFALGYINLGSGNDLRGLHDMHLVERLLSLAVGSKKVSIVHILDKATAGATIALALIYMKTNDKALARKIDVPDTIHLLENVRPDMFLLRTVAANLIMWDAIRGTFDWIKQQLKPFHQDRYKMTTVKYLDSEDLPYYNIMAGLCFSIAMKYAGSGNEIVKEVLLHYLDHFMRLSALPAVNHDQKLTRTTVRNCQDLIALSVSTVMAGTGDIPVFRRLRRLHGRLEADIPYGSHLASHLAIGVLFLGNGSFTFGTENVAIASLLCAFYPLFPTAPLDNKCHLQAFRHLWVLAVENRCLIPRDVESFRPTQVPITIVLRTGEEIHKTAPCLLPELKNVATITTTSPAHWTVVLDFINSSLHRRAFERSQSIFVHRRSAHATQSTVFQATLQALEDAENLKAPMEWLAGLPAFAGLDKAEKALLIREGEAGGGECVDDRLALERDLEDAWNRGRLRGVGIAGLGQGGLWIGEEVREGLRAGVWTRAARDE